jgi:tRNA dimethylallyltransferase
MQSRATDLAPVEYLGPRQAIHARALKPVVLLLGPTASGKSACALEIARRLPCEIISVDSAAVYRGMDAGTAKPSAQARALCPHHLVDILDPSESYSAAKFCTDASQLIADISSRDKLPLLVGGTMLYVKALLTGIDTLPGADAKLREEIDREAASRGWPALHAELAKLDAATAARLAPHDAQRIQRALEVIRLTGTPLSSQLGNSAATPRSAPLIVALLPSDRKQLHRRIEARFDAMLRAGLVDELARLRKQYTLRRELPSMRCVGYRQAWEFLEGEIDEKELRAKGIAATRQLAKRQLTWLRAMPKLTVFDCLEARLETQVANFAQNCTKNLQLR